MVKFIEGKKIYLRPVEKHDLTKDYLRWINDVSNDTLTEHAQLPHTLSELEKYALGKWSDKSCLWLGIYRQKTNKHVGNIEICGIDWIHGCGEYKILVDKKYQGKGFGKEASVLLIQHAFEVLNLHRLQLGVHQDNKGARHLYKRLGFVKEGELRENFSRKGKFKNTIIMGLLASEFKKK